MHVEPAAAQTEPPKTIEPVAPRRPGRWLAVALVAIVVIALVRSLLTNPRYDWGTVGEYLFAPEVLEGLVLTLELTALAMAIGIVGGAVLAIMRISSNRMLSGTSWVYIWFFRGTPVLVQVLFWFNIQALYPEISIGLGFGPSLDFEANAVITPFVAALVGLGLNEAAYMAEITRAGILSVDEGQTEAAQALGMTARRRCAGSCCRRRCG